MPMDREWMEGKWCDAVVDAYRWATLKKFFRAKMGGKTRENAIAFWNLQKTTGQSLRVLMETAVKFYAGEWCLETLGTEYPPLNMVLGDKARARLIKSYPPVEKVTKEYIIRQGQDIAATLIGSLGKEGAMVAVMGGWPDDDNLRAVVRAILETEDRKTSGPHQETP